MKKDKKTQVLSSEKANFESRLVPLKDLSKTVQVLKKKGLRVVLTQGVYDLIHQGHAAYLEKAKTYGDVLIVGVDSDELTRKRKGPGRPIVPQDERLRMLAHLRHVDFVTLRETHHGIGDLIHTVKPDVLIVSKSTKDFDDDMVRSYSSVCGEIVSLPPQATTSTSARITSLTIEGAHKLAVQIQKLTRDFVKKIKGNA